MHAGLLFLIFGAILATAGAILLTIGANQWSGASSQIVPAGATISADKLAAEAIKTSQEIITFVNERQAHEPQQSDYFSRDNFTPELWDAWTAALIRYSSETKNHYADRFGGKVKYLREQFQKWGLSHQDLDQLCLDPTNYIVIREGAIALNLLARQLISK